MIATLGARKYLDRSMSSTKSCSYSGPYRSTCMHHLVAEVLGVAPVGFLRQQPYSLLSGGWRVKHFCRLCMLWEPCSLCAGTEHADIALYVQDMLQPVRIS